MKREEKIFVIKADGNRVPFDIEKLRMSLRRAGASEAHIRTVAEAIEREVKPGMHTADIYRHAFSMLERIESSLAARYSMKRAVLALGPSGFPFERFVAEIFKAKGYTTWTGVTLRGVCTSHEVDLAAKNNTRCFGAELKFHNSLGIKSDIKDALYVHARFEDVMRWQEKNPEQNVPCIEDGWLITNTKFTKKALSYGRCAGLTMLSWGYPAHESLADLIRETQVQPITALTSLSGSDKKRLLDQNIVLCKAVYQNADALASLGVGTEKIKTVVEEARAVCG